MKNKIAFVIILFFCGLLFFLNTSNFKKGKLYTFKRNFTEKKLFSIKGIFLPEFITKPFSSISINNNIYNYSIFQNDSLYNIVHFNNNFDSGKITNRIKLPSNSLLCYYSSEKTVYLAENNLFVKWASDFLKDIHLNQLKINYKIFKAFPINHNGNIFLCIGEKKLSPNNSVDFFVLDMNTAEVFNIKPLSVSYDNLYKNILLYSGNFIITNNRILYYCDKLPYIYLFDSVGNYRKKILTKDKTPNPVILTTSEGTFYKRGSTFTTNNGAFINNNYLYVFSSRSDEKKFLLLDKYDIEGNYLNSFKLRYNKRSNDDIQKILGTPNSIIIIFLDDACLINIL